MDEWNKSDSSSPDWHFERYRRGFHRLNTLALQDGAGSDDDGGVMEWDQQGSSVRLDKDRGEVAGVKMDSNRLWITGVDQYAMQSNYCANTQVRAMCKTLLDHK